MATEVPPKPAEHPCPRCRAEQTEHCKSPTCDWRKCTDTTCRVVSGRKRSHRDGVTVPLLPNDRHSP